MSKVSFSSFFGNLPENDPKVIDFCTGRYLSFPDPGTPQEFGIDVDILYHPHAPKFADYKDDQKAYIKDVKAWFKTHRGGLLQYVKDQRALGDINQWKFPALPPCNATNYGDLKVQPKPRVPIPNAADHKVLVDVIEARTESYYKVQREEQKSGVKKNKQSKKPKPQKKPQLAHDDESRKKSMEQEAMDLLVGRSSEGSGVPVNPKDYVDAKAVKNLGISDSQISLLAELMKQKITQVDEEPTIDQRYKQPSVELIDLKEQDVFSTVVNPKAIELMVEADKSESLKKMVTHKEVEDRMKILADIEKASSPPVAAANVNPFAFEAQSNTMKIADLGINTFQQPPPPNPPVNPPMVPVSKPVQLIGSHDAVSSIQLLLANDSESQLREKAGVSKEDVDRDLMILRSGFLNDDLKNMSDAEIRGIQLDITIKMRAIFQKYIVGAVFDGDHLVDSIREASNEIARLSNPLSTLLYGNLIKIPSTRKEIRLNLVITHFSPFGFIKVLSFESAVLTSKEINTGLAFSNMGQVSSVLQKLMMKLGVHSGMVETALTQMLVLTGMMHSNLADFSKLVHDLSAKMNKEQYETMRKQVINPEMMLPSRLKGTVTTTKSAAETLNYEECTYLVVGFMIIPVKPDGTINWRIYDTFKVGKKPIVKDCYELLYGMSLVIFETLGRFKNHSDLKKMMKELVAKFKGSVYDNSAIFNYITSRATAMTSSAELHPYEVVKKILHAN